MFRKNLGRGTLRHTRALDRAVNFSIERLERRVLLSAVIATNLGDYSPGSTAQINGTGFTPGEAVQLQVRNVSSSAPGTNTYPQNQPWEVYAGADGSVRSTWPVTEPDAPGATFRLTASGLMGDEVAQATFLDSVQTTTTITSSLNPSTAGQSVTFTVTVTSNTPGAGTPTGIVNVNDALQLASSQRTLNASGVVTFTLSLPSDDSFVAGYVGTSEFLPSDAATFNQVVNPLPTYATTTTITSSQNPSTAGQSVTFTVTVTSNTPNVGTPTGTVNVNDALQLASSQRTLNASGVVTFTLSLPSGDSFVAGYVGTSEFLPSDAATFNQVVNQLPTYATTTVITSSQNPSVAGQSVTFTVTVTSNTPNVGTPTGTVNVLDAMELAGGTLTLNASGVATFTLSLSYDDTFVAGYVGTSEFLPSDAATFNQTVGLASTTTLTSSANPAAVNQPITYVARVASDPPGQGTPTGTVKFTFSGFFSQTYVVALTNGAAVLSGLEFPYAGVETVTATYNGSGTFLGSTATLAQNIAGPLYVDPSAGLGADNGSNWANAFTTLTQALAVAVSGDTIEVAEGSYNPGFLITDDATFTLKTGVTIQGGYASGGSSSPDPSVNVTTLDGYGYDSHMVTGSGTNATAVLDGFTIENGAANGSGALGDGGGLFDNNGSPEIIDCTFIGNSVSDGGGAIYNENDSDPTIVNCTFTSNSALQGGAMDNESGSFPFLFNCRFIGNLARLDGGAIYNDTSDVYLLNCTFTFNSASPEDGGYGGAIADVNSSTATVTNCILYNDLSRSDNEIYDSGSTSSITYSDISGGYSGTGNLNANPMFVSGTNLELQTGSPCINTGNNSPVLLVETEDHVSTDLAGNSRIVGSAVDMGAYEYQGPMLLIFSQELQANVTSGSTINSPVVVDQERNGSPVTDGSTVTLSITGNPAGVTLQGNTAIVNTSGQAVFSNLVMSGTPGSYTLTATDGSDSPVTSGSFNLTAQVNSTHELMYTTPPPPSVAVGAMLPSVIVEVVLNGTRDLSDNSIVSLEVNNVTIATTGFVQGRAIFNGLVFRSPGNFSMVAYDEYDYGLASASFTVTSPVVTTALVFGPTPLPTSVKTGSAITPITVTEVPSSGTLNDSTSSVTLALVSGPAGGTLGGTLTEKVSNNVATFSNLTPNIAGTYEISASDGGDTSAEFAITAVAPTAAKLVFSTISSFQAGLNMPVPTFTVSVESNNGSVLASDTSTITVIVLIPNAGAYDPRTATIQAVQGVATFNDYFIGRGSTFTLQASDPADGLTGVSQPFTVTPGPADSLYVTAGAAVAGTSTTIPVQAQDLLGNVAIGDNSSLTLTLDTGPGALGGTLTTSFSAGNALFDDVVFDTAGFYYLTVTEPDNGLSQSFEFTVTANPVPAELTFIQQPSNTSTGYPIDPPVTVGVEDQFGNLITTDESGEVTLSIASGTGSATIGGVITAGVQNGIATFSQATLTAAGTYTLKASDGSDTDATSTSFMVTPPATIFVDQSATGANTGQDWPDAFTSLQSALAIAINGDRIDVAEGDYSPGGEASDTFQLINGVTIQGGYQTGGFSDPNASAYPTLLDGMDTNYNVVTADGNDYSAILEGFTITNGNADGNGDADSGYGGGLVADGGSPTVIDCIFTNNTAVDGGAAFFADEGSTSATLVNCLFYANTASQSGGAIFDVHASSTLTNCTFTANSAFEFGGAIENDSASSPTLTNCILWNDAAGDSFNEISNDYVDFEFGSSNPVVTYSDVDGGYSGTGNIDADPTFVSPVSNNYQLQATSPCINAGDNGAPALAGVNTDLAGDPRINDGVVDLGAYETQLSTATIYVDQDASGANNGLSWSNAYTSLQSALAAALPGNTIDVAQGDYSPGSDPTDTFQLLDLVTIQGGFPTGGASSPDPAAYPTILDGMENNYHVVTGDGTNSNAVLEGFTIANGNAYGYGDANSTYGGGLVADGGSPTVINCIFTNNTAALDGGAVYNVDSSPTFVDCLFVANTATYYGGAIDDIGASPFFTNCTFTANVISDYYGTAIESDFNSDPTLTNCILWNDNGGIGTEIDTGLGYGLYKTTVNNSDVGPAFQYVGGAGNIDADPMFVDPANGNYQLQPTSPCINVGDNDAPGLATVGTDLAANPRIIDGVVDMGAYEAQSIAVTWTGADDGISWSDPFNWSDNLVPTPNDSVLIPAGFTNIQVGGAAFSVGAVTSASPIEIQDGGSLTLFAPAVLTATLTVDTGGSLAANNAADVSGNIVDDGNVTVDYITDPNFDANVSGSGSLTIDGLGTVVLDGDNTYTGGTNIDSGILAIANIDSLPVGGVIVNNGTLSIQAGTRAAPVISGLISGSGTLAVGTASAPGYLQLQPSNGSLSQSSLTIAATSTLDITNNTLTINFTPGSDPAMTIRKYLASGYGGDTWKGPGIVSSNAQANPGLYAVGYVDGNVDAGTPAAANQILIRNTLAGDANLDGTVNFADLLVVAQNFNHALDTHGNAIDWADGDFNYDGKVNFADLLLVAQNFNKRLAVGQSAQTPGSSGAVVPTTTETLTPLPAPNTPTPSQTTTTAAVDATSSAPAITTNAPSSPATSSASVSAPVVSAPVITTDLTAAGPAPEMTPVPSSPTDFPPPDSVEVLGATLSASTIPPNLTDSSMVTEATVVLAKAFTQTRRIAPAGVTAGLGNLSPAGNANIRPAKAKTRLVVAAPPALPTDSITNDALVGVWNAITSENNLIFSDSPQRDRLR